MNIHHVALECLLINDVAHKIRSVNQLYDDYHNNLFRSTTKPPAIERIPIPGRPSKPELVSPKHVKQRKLTTEKGRATLIHAITHIEFNAINLALDAIYRFRHMPEAFYKDWISIAKEESMHFNLLHDRLNQLDYKYGDFPAHNGLWEMTVKTDHDVMIRMALVPRVLEARGLDVTPAIIAKLAQVDDHETVTILKTILHDEIGHVAIGSYWFHYCCKQRSISSQETFIELIKDYMHGGLRGPFNKEARLDAGFTEKELLMLDSA